MMKKFLAVFRGVILLLSVIGYTIESVINQLLINHTFTLQPQLNDWFWASKVVTVT